VNGSSRTAMRAARTDVFASTTPPYHRDQRQCHPGRYHGQPAVEFKAWIPFSRMTMRTTPYFANRENVLGRSGVSRAMTQDPGNWGRRTVLSSGIAALADAAPCSRATRRAACRSPDCGCAGRTTSLWRSIFSEAAIQPARAARIRGTSPSRGAPPATISPISAGVPDTSANSPFGNADKYSGGIVRRILPRTTGG